MGLLFNRSEDIFFKKNSRILPLAFHYPEMGLISILKQLLTKGVGLSELVYTIEDGG